MDQAEITMRENLHKNTGKTLEQWIEIVKTENFRKHGDIIRFLKEKHNFTHGFANMVAMKARGADARSVENKDELIEKQFAILQPATKSRFEIVLNLKGESPIGKLEEIKTANAMCSHKINIAAENDIDNEVIDWIKKAYQNAG